LKKILNRIFIIRTSQYVDILSDWGGEIMVEEEKLSRRNFLYGSGGFAAGLALAGGGLGMLSGCVSEPQERVVEVEKIVEKTISLTAPLPYTDLDTKVVAELAYENWYKDFCSYAVVSSIIDTLAEVVGSPYTSIPSEAFRGFHGGAVGWGTLCGTLTGAGIVTGLIAGRDGEAIFNDVMSWYTKTDLPTYTPDNPRATIQNTNKSLSPLCHISVGKWMDKEGVDFPSPERKTRCARVASSVAVKTVELLTAWSEGTYTQTHGSQISTNGMPSQNNCVECHGDDVPMVP
jgi:hypothetical protein